MAGETHAADACGFIVELDFPIPRCQDGFELREERRGAGNVPTVVHVQVDGKGVEGVEEGCCRSCVDRRVLA